MSNIYKAIDRFMRFFEKKEKEDPTSYFDLSSEDKKKVIDQAAKGAMEMQNELLKEYNKKFLKKGEEKYFYRNESTL